MPSVTANIMDLIQSPPWPGRKENHPRFPDVETEAPRGELNCQGHPASERWSWESYPRLGPACAHNICASIPTSEPSVCSQHLCLHQGPLKRGFNHNLPISGSPLEALSSPPQTRDPGCSLGSTTNLLCDLRQITFPFCPSLFPSKKQAVCTPF